MKSRGLVVGIAVVLAFAAAAFVLLYTNGVKQDAATGGSLSTVIAKNLGNITNLKITNRSTDFFDMLLDIEVRDVKHLSNIIAALRATPAINSVERARK